MNSVYAPTRKGWLSVRHFWACQREGCMTRVAPGVELCRFCEKSAVALRRAA